jgi:hypothetical protein|tara:strand:+ start:1889 stop:2896 length:1008 start_codon:yes stop_codon:yes gene_type:complete
MAFSWVGFKNYVDWADEKQAEEQKRMDDKEALIFSIAGKYGVDFLNGGANTTLAGASATTEGFNQAASSKSGIAVKVLQDKYNISDDVLVPIIASGDKEGPAKLLAQLEKQRIEYEKRKMQIPESVIAQIAESAITTQPSGKKINFDKMEEYIGREMDSLYKAILTAQSTKAGEVFVPEAAFAPNPDQDDLDRFEKRALSFNVSRAANEISLLNKQLTTLQQLQESQNLSVQKQAELSWITDRLVEVKDKLESYEKGNIVPIAGLYGTLYFDQLLEAYPSFKGVPLNPALLNESKANQITVPSRAVAESLARAGILKVGDVVINLETNKKIKIGG